MRGGSLGEGGWTGKAVVTSTLAFISTYTMTRRSGFFLPRIELGSVKQTCPSNIKQEYYFLFLYLFDQKRIHVVI